MDSEARAEAMNLRVGELLKDVQLNYSPSVITFVDGTVTAIRDAINRIPEDENVTADIAPGFVRDIGTDKVDFKFKKPKSIAIGGSYSIQCIVKPDVNVDLLIRLPKECFHEKDYLNHRYHAKRFLYLCIIKKYLESSTFKVKWSTLQNEARKPVLLVYSATSHVEVPGFLVRIIPTATSLFNVSKLNSKRNNIKALKREGSVSQSTPMYNHSILEDMFLEDKTEFIKKTFLEWKELREALILLKVWARQRSSIYTHDCLNGFLLSVIVSYLATEWGWKRIDHTMKSIQIFRVILDFIATSKLWANGLYFKLQGQQSIPMEERRHDLQAFPVVLCDLPSRFNYAFRITGSGFCELRDEAALTLSCMDKCRDGGFEEIFMIKIDYSVKYDYCIRLKLGGKNEVHALGFCLDKECWRLYEQKVHSLLNQGLSDRVKLIRATWRNTLSDCNIENGFSMFDREPLLVGISFSSLENAHRVVNVGPNAENKEEVLKFRKFWGEKAELRRFKDGTIAESTVWESKQWERHLVVKRITEFVLCRHLSLSNENMVPIVDQLDFSLHRGVGDSISHSKSLLEAFEVLSKRLRLLKDIPLSISSVQPIDPAFRFTSVYPPEPHPLATENSVLSRSQKLKSTCIQPLEVMIQLEGSGNWPMTEVAIEKTKSAFLLQIVESLQSNWGMTFTASEDDVDVLVSGYAFRLKILHERGLTLLKGQVGSDYAKWVSSIDKELFIHGQHSSMINGLQGCFPTYGPVVRLAKRWVASHLFSSRLVDEAVELLVAHLFLKPLPYCAPCSRISGFLRFLRLLSEYDWEVYPLVVDINSDMSPDDEKEIYAKFMSRRKAHEENPQDANSAIFIATAYDKASEAWTRTSPDTMELRRLVAYARSSAVLLTKLVLQDQTRSYQWECIFRTPLNNFDAVLLLHRDRLPYPQNLLFVSELCQGRLVARGKASKKFYSFIRGMLEELKNNLMVNFDPLRCFLVDFERKFPKLKIWYDSLGGDAIGLTWDRSISKKRRREEAGEEDIDPIEVLKAVGEVGKGFVRSVHLLKAPKIQH